MRPRGRIENEVLALLRQETGTLDAVELAARIYHINPVSKAACSAVRRALNSLARKGLVRAGSRQHSNARRRWYANDPGHHDIQPTSDRAIASLTNVSPSTVARVRRGL
jgi:Fe2+ or Zn2+ uptake regulation protein